MNQRKRRHIAIENETSSADISADIDESEINQDENNENIASIKRKRIKSGLDNNASFPIFVPGIDSYLLRTKWNWTPLSASSKDILLQFVKGAKNNCLPTVPDSRREDVISVINHMIASTNRKISERVFPRSAFMIDSYDLEHISQCIAKLEKQNSLLSHQFLSLVKDEKEENIKLNELKSDKNRLENEIKRISQSHMAILANHPTEYATTTTSDEEKILLCHRQIEYGIWREFPRGVDYYEKSEWWKSMEKDVTERFKEERSLRIIIKRMAKVDQLLTHIFNELNNC